MNPAERFRDTDLSAVRFDPPPADDPTGEASATRAVTDSDADGDPPPEADADA